jgi:glycogen debranching enzyme
LQRIPELFCGFTRVPAKAPVLYPVACSPQAWASGAVFLMLQASLGLSVRASEQAITFTRPLLPEWLENLQIRDLRVGEATVDLLLTRYKGGVALKVERREGEIEIRLIQ